MDLKAFVEDPQCCSFAFFRFSRDHVEKARNARISIVCTGNGVTVRSFLNKYYVQYHWFRYSNRVSANLLNRDSKHLISLDLLEISLGPRLTCHTEINLLLEF